MRVVVLRPLGLGDFLTGVPAYRAIAGAFPRAQRILAAPRALAPLAALLGDTFHDVLDAQPLAPLDPALHGADVAVDLHGKGPASHRVLLAAQPKRLVAFANDAIAQSAGGAVWRAGEHEVRRWCRMLDAAGIPADPAALGLGVPTLAPFAAGVTIVHPGAASAARCWPPERFAAVASAELQARRRVVITGSASEAALAQHVAARAGVATADVVAGRTSLLELAALVASASRVVCGDTGIAHLATAFRTPSVTLFGPVSPAEWGPPADRDDHRVLWAGRRGDPHGSTTDDGLLEITVADVVAALRRLPQRKAAMPAYGVAPSATGSTELTGNADAFEFASQSLPSAAVGSDDAVAGCVNASPKRIFSLLQAANTLRT